MADDARTARENLLADYAAIARRNGSTASSADIERLVVSDLETSDAVERHKRPSPPRRRPKRQRKGAEKLAAEMGYEAFQRPIPKQERPSSKGFLQRKPRNPRQAMAIKRLGEILSPRSWFRPSRENDYQMPDLAQRFIETMTELDRGAGEFAGRSAADAERIVWRRIEDICDKSTGALGPWRER